MKRTIVVLVALAMLMVAGCSKNKNNQYLPETKNDKIYTTVKNGEGNYQGEGYTLAVPAENYRYEKDYDDGTTEEKWEYTKKDDVQVKVSIYKNSDEKSARSRFLQDNDDYIFEDLMGYPLCGVEPDGDELWFNLYESNAAVYIVSWEYPKNTKEELKTELSNIAQTFKLSH